MRYETATLRTGLAAIAAVLALSTNPASAQGVDAQPLTVTEPPVAASPTVPATDAVPPLIQSAPPATSVPVLQIDPALKSIVAPTSPPEAAPPSAPKARAAPVAPRAATPKRAETVTPPPQVKQAPTSTAAPSMTPVAIPAAPVAAEALPEARVSPPAPVADRTVDGDTLTAGAAALAGVIALGGGLWALLRRRRTDADDAPYPEYEPETAVPVRAASALPAGFDLSRYGPYMQAAYRGPTPDNPSLSLRKRLKRASFMDQRLRRQHEEKASANPGQAPEAELELTRPASPILDQTGHLVTSEIRWSRANFRPAPRGRPKTVTS